MGQKLRGCNPGQQAARRGMVREEAMERNSRKDLMDKAEAIFAAKVKGQHPQGRMNDFATALWRMCLEKMPQADLEDYINRGGHYNEW
jgi:hypothetical protein